MSLKVLFRIFMFVELRFSFVFVSESPFWMISASKAKSNKSNSQFFEL